MGSILIREIKRNITNRILGHIIGIESFIKDSIPRRVILNKQLPGVIFCLGSCHWLIFGFYSLEYGTPNMAGWADRTRERANANRAKT